MKARADRIQSLSETFATLLEQENRACQEMVFSLIESAKTLQGNMADRRLQRHAAQLKKLQARLELLVEMAHNDFLTKIRREAEELKSSLADSRVAAVLVGLIEAQPCSLNLFCELLLDRLIEVTQAGRGFFVLYLPESTEADVIAARNFQTTNLSLEEYCFSRTLLREVFRCGEPIFLEDAAHDPKYSKEASVRKFDLKSVMVVPMKQSNRTIGALYLEDNRNPSAFDKEEIHLLESMARFAIFYLNHARLLPIVFQQENRVFFDASKASEEIVGQDPKIFELLRVIKRIADSPATVLIEGESGTGKELVARALHYGGARRDHPFVAINCAAIPENLLESELFGHEKGSFTGAIERHIGHVEQGDGGTIFLDEISELAYPLQAKLLRFLQSNEFRRVGGKENIGVDVRIVAATSKDLKRLMESGKFQEALYYRLNVIPVRLPALRERRDDIPLLIDHFLKKFSSLYGDNIRIEREVYEWLKSYSFPGNVRELENLIHRLVALAQDDLICLGDLPGEILQISSRRISLESDPIYQILHTPPADLDDLRRRKEEIKRVLAEQERQLTERAVQEAGGNLTEAATKLGVHRVTLHKMVRKTKR